MKRHSLISACILAFLPCLAAAQETERHDTLEAAVKTDSRRVLEAIGEIRSDIGGVRRVVSPLGEGDPVRWAQTLPGVSTGADGTTAFYVRGGNMGNNLITLDGVPVYGYSHLLGLTTIIPQEVMSDVSVSKGGFDGSTSSFTAAHLDIRTRRPGSGELTVGASLNNFLAGVNLETPLSEKVSLMVSARMSPLALEYRAVRGMLPDLLGGFEDFGAGVGDVYGKLHWQTGTRSSLNASFLGSMDSYSFTAAGDAREAMGWNNMVGILGWHHDGLKGYTDVRASYNRYGSMQEQTKEFRGVVNHLSLKSVVTEYMLGFDRIRSTMRPFMLDYGASVRYAEFAPGQVASVDNSSSSVLATAYLQARYAPGERLSLKAAARGHYYRNVDDRAMTPTDKAGRHDLDFSASLKWNITEHLALEATFDDMLQYYHTLEGLPVGWSLDMLVSSGMKILPESSMQGNVGFLSQIGKHSLSAGAFYKEMENLVYYKYAQTLFSGGMAAWEDDVELGRGTSYGAELMHEYVGRDLYTRISYTWSKTNRFGFPGINDGREFHARFDRRHVLNAVAQWKRFSAALALQSGHWENGAAETYPMHVPGAEWTADYYSGINNYHMPTVFRLDLGYMFSFKTGPVRHDVNVGVCNVTNHFNPFMLYFDASSESWKMIALLPIMPNFSWRAEF